MLSWLKLGRSAAPVSKPPPAALPARAAASASAPVRPAAPTPQAVAPPPAPVARAAALEDLPVDGLGVRRPLVGRQGQVAGFELLLAPAVERRLAGRADTPSAQLYHRVLLNTAAAVAAGGRAALVRLPAAALAQEAMAALVPPGAWVAVSDLATLPAAQAEALRARGAHLGVPDGPPQAEPSPDFVLLQGGAAGIDSLLLSVQRWREVLPRVRLVCTGLQHLEDVEQLLQAGVDLASGELGRSRSAPPPRPLGAAALRIVGLLNDLAQDRDTSVIADAVRGDATLTYRLLRYANSPAIGLKRAVEAVDDAVQLLGRAELRRWLSVQLAASSPGRAAGRALEESALARGRILEALAQQNGELNAGAHFTFGVLSLIEPLLQVPVAQALGPLRLGEDFRAALLHRQGALAPRLAMLEAWDRGDDEALEQWAVAVGGTVAQMRELVAVAWQWATEVDSESP
ncbi:EAL and HDOD domain-containing protein [Rubrivivax rivuli]|uniref:HDOD domain-containing protein n=1 Tax=Rubrivivax rivuli TaxID=1862385 RepID=A0A437RRN5_9BURK|nr:HDOD domain-containing protein [Rubrivivax rivuli]RVU49438.1 HDOD domain-containing protein [Rubrivivax rivuli]